MVGLTSPLGLVVLTQPSRVLNRPDVGRLLSPQGPFSTLTITRSFADWKSDARATWGRGMWGLTQDQDGWSWYEISFFVGFIGSIHTSASVLTGSHPVSGLPTKPFPAERDVGSEKDWRKQISEQRPE